MNKNIIMLEIKANCDAIFTPEALEIINEVLGWFRILAPIVLICLVALDYGKAVLSNEQDNIKKATSIITKRILATIGLFLVPTLVMSLLNFSSVKELISSDYLCTNATGTTAKKAVATTSSKDNNSTVSNVQTNIDGTNTSLQIGSHANSKNEVCLKNQSGLRDKYQKELEKKVNQAGKYTRNGVVAAAIYISSEIGIKIPYFPGGCHSMSCLRNGIPNNIGCKKTVTHNAHKWPSSLPAGFDCSGFTFWSYGIAFGDKSRISSEMHNYGNSSTKVYNEKTGKTESIKVERVDITKNNIGYITNLLMPGDLVGTNGHVGMVIDTSRLKSEGIYTVAHASSASMQLSIETFKLAPKNKWGQVVLMRKFFLRYDCVNRNDSSSCEKFECIKSKQCDSSNIKY